MTTVAALDWETLLRAIPGYDPFETAGDSVFVESKAIHAIRFFEEILTHVKGRLAGSPLLLEGWQRSVLANMFGWRNSDGTRRYTEAFIYVPRKNGKTTLVSGIPVYILATDKEAGKEIYVAAADKDQAKICHEISKQMIVNEPELSKRLNVYRNSIVHAETNSFFKPVSKETQSKHGYDANVVIVDELHAQEGRELVDVLETSQGSRENPLLIHITTADFQRESICNEKLDYAEKVRDGILNDPSFLPVIYSASVEDDWKDEEVWKRANPNYGISLQKPYFRKKFNKALVEPSFENTFKRLHLNIQTEQKNRFLSLDYWDSCSAAIDLEALEGCSCYGGLDLSSTTDITALVLYFPDNKNALVPFFWVPRQGAEKREKGRKATYLTWANEGLVELTKGARVDYDEIRVKILNDLFERFDIVDIGYDRWNASSLISQLEAEGMTMTQFGQGFASMSSPMKEFEALVVSKGLRHGGNKVLRWMFSNLAADEDAAGNIKPNKEKSGEKIDGIVGAIMAIGVAGIDDDSGNVYDERGFLSV